MRNHKVFILGVIIAVVVLLNMPVPSSIRLKMSTRDNLAPFQNVFSLFLLKARSGLSFLLTAGSIAEEKESLLEDNANLMEQLRSFTSLKRENDQLRALLKFKKKSRYELIACQVVSRGDVSGWWHSIRLNKGLDDGVLPDMAVITTEGLIGRTMKDVSKHTCEVLLLTDKSNLIGCKFKDSKHYGLLQGMGVSVGGKAKLQMLSTPEFYRMKYIPNAHALTNDEVVVTSGLGGVFPEGLLIGRVWDGGSERTGLSQFADVVPAADMQGLKYVFVVNSKGSTVAK